jgi:glutamine amidotransferase
MENLAKYNLLEILSSQVIAKKKLFLGICLGMQLLSSSSTEGGEQRGLNWISGDVVKITSNDETIKIPHMGWNPVKHSNDSILYKNIKNSSSFYFVHSYHFVPQDKSIITGTCFHGVPINSSLQKDNIFATQFHPEKSHDVGTELLNNFLNQ